MDEQRLEAYLNLIDALLTCPSGEESDILNVHQDLIDKDLVQTMEDIAAEILKEGNRETAEWLQDMAAELEEVISKFTESSTSQEYLDFLIEVLLAIEESQADPEVVYPLLQANLNKLDENLAEVLRDWTNAAISEANEPEEAYGIAVAVGNFSFLIQHFSQGNYASHIEIALTGYEVVTNVISREAFPEDWGIIQNNLGLAYLNRIEGDVVENKEAALAAFQAALQVRNCEAVPQQWAESKNNLGLAYYHRIQGEQAENIEQAIRCYESALQVYTYEAFPLQWAMIQDDLGNIYCDRIRGDWVENWEAAITAFKSALQVYTRDTFPEDWARIQNNLATVYSDHARGDKAENLELAITCCKNALQVYLHEVFPEDWAMVLTNLGVAYRTRVQGDRAENLETAIHCYQAALQEHTYEQFPEDWAGLQNNLGNAYRERIKGDRVENLEQALRYFNFALEVYSRESFPQDWAMIQNNLALTYYEQGQIEEAIARFQSALESCTPFVLPHDCLQYAGNLGDKAFLAGRWTDALTGYRIAIEVIEQTRSWVSTDVRRQEMLQEDIEVYENMVQACINNRQLDLAIEYVERSRSRRLVDLMASNDLYQDGEIPSQVQEYLQQYESLQQRIDQDRFGNNSEKERELAMIGSRRSVSEASPPENRAALESINEVIAALEAKKQQVWQQLRRLDPVLAGQIQVIAPNLAAMQQLIDQPTTTILSFYTTSNDTHIFVLQQNQIACHTCLGQGQKTLQDWIDRNWLKPYLASCDSTKLKPEQERLRSIWKKQISPFLTELAQRLQLNDLITQHLSGVEEIILVPHIFLHQIPFAALPIGNGQYLGDKFLIRYIPSCQVLEFCQKRPSVSNHLNYGTVEDATEDLPYASFEGEQIAQLYNIPENRRLKGRTQATVSNYKQLAKQIQVLHSSHHAQSRLDNPLESRLYLGDGSITLGQLMTPGWRLPHLSDVFLSCCETGLGITELTDDILTLSTGFLCAGARSVVSTLWAVDDLATALFSIFYHRLRQQGSCRPAALQQAQEELRSLSGQALATAYQPQITLLLDRKFQEAEKTRKEAKANRDKVTKGTPAYLKWDDEYKQNYQSAERIRKTKNRLNALCQEAFPFSHAFYWAAFTCSGLR